MWGAGAGEVSELQGRCRGRRVTWLPCLVVPKSFPYAGCGFLHHGKVVGSFLAVPVAWKAAGLKCQSRSLCGEAVVAPEAERGSERYL